MSATFALFRIQAHALFWPFWICLAVWIVGMFLGNLPALGMMVNSSIMGSWIAGGLVFGIEYMEGARDYIATRPVSAAKVVWTKILSIIIYVVACHLAVSILSDKPIFSHYRYDNPGFLAALLIFAFSSAAFTILFQDFVRGLIGSGVMLAVLAFLINNYRISLLYNTSIDGSSHLRRLIGEPMLEVSASLILVLIPLLALGFLTAIYHSRASHRFHIPISSLLLFGIVAAGMSFIGMSSSLEGKSSFNYLYGPGPGTWQVKEVNLLYLEKVSEEVIIKQVNLNTPSTEPSTGKISANLLGNGIPLSFCGDIITRASISQAGKHNYHVQGIEIYKMIGPTSAELVTSESVHYIQHDPDHQSIVYLTPSDKWRRLSCCSGEIMDENNPPEIDQKRLESRQIFGPERTEYNIQQANEAGWTAKLYPTGYTAPVQEIQLSRNNDNNEDIMRVPIPARFQTIPNILVKVCYRLGFQFQSSGLEYYPSTCSWNLSITMGGGFLCVWDAQLCRMALWRFNGTESPEFIGIAPTREFRPEQIAGLTGPDPARDAIKGIASPYIRPDGALGFLFENYGILWLEFPALMKETKS